MNKFENVYQDAVLMRRVLLGEADEAEQQELEKRLEECPELRKIYTQLQDGGTLSASKIFIEKSLSVFPSKDRTS